MTQVTVFVQGAQVEREASFALQKGQTVLKLTGLSPYIRKESLRVSGDGSYVILNVQHRNDYLNGLNKREDIEHLEQKIKEVQLKVEDEEAWIKIIKDKLDFLYTNKDIAGKEQGLDPEDFKTLNAMYGHNTETLNLDLLKRQRKMVDYKKELSKLKNQRSSVNNKADLPSGTLLVTIDSKQGRTSKIAFNYLVDHATWYPSYDVRFQGIEKPLNLIHKANIRQNTGVDWNEVKLVLSTTKTNIAAEMPLLHPFYLRFYEPISTMHYRKEAKDASLLAEEVVFEEESDDLVIRGAAASLDASNPLYIVDGVPQEDISSLAPSEIESLDVLKDASATAIYGARGANGVVLVTTRYSKGERPMPLTISTKSETSNAYTVDASQTILSNNEVFTVNFMDSDLAADFEYQSIPKLSENVFLIGKIKDWHEAELIDGEVNLYLENSFVGKSSINTSQFSDTLNLSFGTDNNISVKREKLTDFSEKKLIGANRKETIAHKITLRNNKSYAVSTVIYDQIPISTTKDIQVEVLETSAGKVDKDFGRLEWKITLNPNENKELIVKYAVKYPKDKNVFIE